MNAPSNHTRLVWLAIFATLLLTSSAAEAQNCTSGLVYFTHAGHHYWRCENQIGWAAAQNRCAAFSPYHANRFSGDFGDDSLVRKRLLRANGRGDYGRAIGSYLVDATIFTRSLYALV